MAENASSPARLIHEASVVRQQDHGHGYFVMELACPELAASIGVGQFVNVRIRNEHSPLLRRPFSVFDVFRDAKGNATGISLLYHTVGAGTRLMSRMPAGTLVNLLGPLGQAFPTPPAGSPVVMVGGGIGLAPFLLQAKRGLEAAPAGQFTLVAGGRTDKDLRYMSAFRPLVSKGLNLLLCTEDGSLGIKGRVTVPLQGELAGLARRGESAWIFACGPTPMMAAVSEMAAGFGMTCIVSLESVMACGYGVCNGCVAPVRDEAAAGGIRWTKTCTTGPAFEGAKLAWDRLVA